MYRFKGRAYSFQQEDTEVLINTIKSRGGAIYAADTGMGKSIVALLVSLSIARKRVLIIAPTILLNQWAEYVKKFTTYKPCILHGNNSVDPLANVFITSYGMVSTRNKKYRHVLFRFWRFIIIDEIHNARNPKTALNSSFLRLNSEHKLCLTATPFGNEMRDLVSEINLFFPCLEHFDNIKDAKKRRVYTEMLIKLFVIRRKLANSGINMPVLTIRKLSITCKPVVAEHLKHGFARLSYTQQHEGTSEKLSATLNLLIENVSNGKATVVLTRYKRSLSALGATLSSFGIDYARIDGEMSRSAVDEALLKFKTRVWVLIATSQKAGEGLNIGPAHCPGARGREGQAVGEMLIQNSWWNPTVFQQECGRLVRASNPLDVTVTLIMSSIDKKIYTVSERKSRMIKGIFGDCTLSKEEWQEIFGAEDKLRSSRERQKRKV